MELVTILLLKIKVFLSEVFKAIMVDMKRQFPLVLAK
jgi:hypothetical protein